MAHPAQAYFSIPNMLPGKVRVNLGGYRRGKITHPKQPRREVGDVGFATNSLKARTKSCSVWDLSAANSI
jgi:hypothetical protein